MVGAEALQVFDGEFAALLDLLHTTDPRAPVPNWSTGPDLAGWWLRRTAHDVAVHRWDAANLAGAAPAPIPADLARDGVAEFFDVFVATSIAGGMAPQEDATLAAELTDIGERHRDLLRGRRPGARRRMAAVSVDAAVGVAAVELWKPWPRVRVTTRRAAAPRPP